MVMKGLSQSAELLYFSKDPNDSEWYYVDMAINGIPAVRFSVGTPIVNDYLNSIDGERQLGEYLERQALMMIEQYGDRRNPKFDQSLFEQGA